MIYSPFDIKTAYKLLNEESPEKALDYAEQWLTSSRDSSGSCDSPDSVEALQFCGIVYAKQNNFERALSYFKRAHLQIPNEISCHINLSNVYVALKNTELAIQHLHEALRLNPQHAATYNNLGRLLYKQGLIPDAISKFEKALRINPDFWEAHYNLAHSLANQNQMDRSATHYQEVIRLFPEHPIAHFNLGLIYVDNQNYPLAETHLKKALLLDESNSEAAKQLGQVYVNLGETENAMLFFEKALKLSPNLPDAHHNLAILYLRNKVYPQALTHFQTALTLDPTNDTARHMIRALSEGKAKSAPSQYIEKLFDQYAEYYNEHLKAKLKYKAPALLRNAVGRCLEKNPKAGRVLDLGCGTGLCGIVFRDLARDLIGIDLSPNMIEQARILGAYDTLLVKDINEYLKDPSLKPFDLIIAADVLVYSGDLEELFKLVAKKLVPHGHFAFTIESLETGTYTLQTTGRFAHSIQYIHELAQQNHFKFAHEESITLREQEGISIAGQLIVLTR